MNRKGSCRAKTTSGSPCKRATKHGCKYCWQHQPPQKQRGGQNEQPQQQPYTAPSYVASQPLQYLAQQQPMPLQQQPMPLQQQPMPVQQVYRQPEPALQRQMPCVTAQELQMILQQCGLCTGKDSRAGSTIGEVSGLVSNVAQATPSFLSAFKDIKGLRK